jgi:hypothetical protein
MLTLENRRGRSGQFEYREGGRRWSDYWLLEDTEQVAGAGLESGLAQGVEQDWLGGLRSGKFGTADSSGLMTGRTEGGKVDVGSCFNH